ncbi:MAG: hypothetical protein HY755_02290 [Nitrospirae bacterium]|nr:hypothetical protein [Nitrospirota bacterium]
MKTNFIVQILGAGIMVFAVVAFLSGLYVIAKSTQLSLYLKKNRYERWREFGLGFNSFKALRYIKSDVDNEDEQILRLKDSIKIGMRHMAIFILAIVVSGGILIILTVTTE